MSQHTLKNNNPALLDSIWTGLKFVPKGYALRLPPDRTCGSRRPDYWPRFRTNSVFGIRRPISNTGYGAGTACRIIAVRYNTTVSELMTINNLKSRHRIRAGQVLNLPYKGSVQQAAISSGTESYTVRSGDTLGLIARRSGVSESELLALNGLANGNRIYIGQELRLLAAGSNGHGIALLRRPGPWQ